MSEEFRLTDRELASLFFQGAEVLEAERILTEECLAEQGITAWRAIGEAPVAMDRQLTFSGLPAPLTTEGARSDGYGLRLVTTADPTGPIGGSNSPRYFEAVTPSHSSKVEVTIPGTTRVIGAPIEGCSAVARRALYGSVEQWIRLDQTAKVGIRQFAAEATRHPIVVDAAANYAACMSRRGYETSNPGETLQLASTLFGGEERQTSISTEERDMAVDDAHCQESSEVYPAIESATLELAGRWIAEHRGELRRLLQVQRDTQHRAASITRRSR